MDRTLSRERENLCIQEQPPACTAACPVHVNVRGMIAALAKQDFAEGYAQYVRTIPFPGIISRICDAPCEKQCKRGEVGDAVEIRALEQACVEYCDKAPKKSLSTPTRNKRVAVVGSSLNGLTAAFDLIRKGYLVVIFEAKNCLGGRLRSYDEHRLPPVLIEKELSIFAELGAKVLCESPVADAGAFSCETLLTDYDAVYLGTAFQKCTHSEVSIDLDTYATDREKLFGGVETASSPIEMILQGRVAAISMDRFLQNASISAGREPLGSAETSLYTDIRGIDASAAIQPADGNLGYSREEAVAEAGRCLQCQCLECVKKCEYLAHYGGYPRKYIREIYNNDSIVMGIHYANKMINSCALCGLCRTVCPNGLDMGEVVLEARQRMVEKGKMPLSTHDFALRDLEFSTSEPFALARHQPGFDHSRYLFFPGCQLSASAPDHVLKTYEFLREKLPGGVGILLNCCGASAEWAGRQDLFAQTLNGVEMEWRRLGTPTVITACSNCYRIFSEHWLEMKIETLWAIMDKVGLPENVGKKNGGKLCVHDPCMSREDFHTQNSVRSLLDKLGIQLEETSSTRKETTCCGYGGLMSFANPEIAKKIVHRRSNESALDYVAYCAMCRDNFAAQGKRTFHLLDLIWGADETAASRLSPDYSTRRENRTRVKNRLLREVYQETGREEIQTMRIEIPDSVRLLMEQRMILVEDVHQVISHAETSSEKMLDQATGHRIAHYRPGCVTYWVEYSAREDGFVVHNAYSHRMLVVEEAGS